MPAPAPFFFLGLAHHAAAIESFGACGVSPGYSPTPTAELAGLGCGVGNVLAVDCEHEYEHDHEAEADPADARSRVRASLNCEKVGLRGQ